jgi:hypothetical protein
MKTRTLRRKVIIREYDYERVRKQAFAPLTFMGMLDTLYDRSEFKLITRQQLEHENLIKLLKDDKKTGLFQNLLKPTTIPSLFLFNVKDYLYDQRYIEWHSEYDEDGYIWVQARKNTPRSRLGWAIFEKDLISRL